MLYTLGLLSASLFFHQYLIRKQFKSLTNQQMVTHFFLYKCHFSRIIASACLKSMQKHGKEITVQSVFA